MNPNNVVGTPRPQAQPVAPVAPVASAAPAEQPEEPNPMTLGPKKASKGGIIAAILFAIIAVGGVGFGVWTMMDSKTKEEQLNSQIDALKKTNNELMDKIAEGGSEEEPGTGATVDTENYIYVGEWGMKIKISDGLKRVSYGIRQTDIVSGGSFLWVWGNVDERLPGFANPSENSSPLGVIGRLPIANLNGADCHADTFELVFSDDEYNYCYSHPQGVYSDGDEELGYEKMATELIERILKDEGSYSKI